MLFCPIRSIGNCMDALEPHAADRHFGNFGRSVRMRDLVLLFAPESYNSAHTLAEAECWTPRHTGFTLPRCPAPAPLARTCDTRCGRCTCMARGSPARDMNCRTPTGGCGRRSEERRVG